MLLGRGAPSHPRGTPRVLFIKARVEQHGSDACAPALGIMYLGAVARECGWDARCVDAYLEDDPETAIREAIAELEPRVIGLSALTSESKSMHRFARIAREAAPDAVVLAGGPHASAYAADVLADPAIDGVVIGEGEVTLQEILERLSFGKPWRDVAGIMARGPDGNPVTNPSRPYVEDLDTLPLPAWDLTDVDAYSKRRGQSLAGLRRYMPLMTSRGCPYRCTYCHDIQGKRFRSHSPEYVLRLMDELGERLSVFNFDIIDDIFNFDAERMLAICDGIIERRRKGAPIRFTFPNGVRADRLTPAQVDRLAQAGCEYAALAIETATKRLQKQIKKHLRFDKTLPVIEAFHRNDVFTAGFFMLGFPSETEAEVKDTIDFAVRSKLHAAFFFVVTPFQGTELHDEVASERSHELPTDLTLLFARQKINLSAVPDARFFALRREAHVRFYFRPRRIASIWRAFPRRAHLLKLAFVMLTRDTLRLQPGALVEPVTRLRARMRRVVNGEAPRPARSPNAWRPIPALLPEPGRRAHKRKLAVGVASELTR